jgi:hypothetical protein
MRPLARRDLATASYLPHREQEILANVQPLAGNNRSIA